MGYLRIDIYTTEQRCRPEKSCKLSSQFQVFSKQSISQQRLTKNLKLFVEVCIGILYATLDICIGITCLDNGIGCLVNAIGLSSLGKCNSNSS